MNKKSTIILLVAVFISGNAAALLFAHGRTKIVEKVVTVYKNAAAEEAKEGTQLAADKVGVLSAKGVEAKKSVADFNDADYLDIGNSGDSEPAAVQTEATADAAINNGQEKQEEPKTAPTGHQGISGGGAANLTYLNGNDTGEVSRMADENIPVPQLPLFDTDFESSVDSGGRSDILMPELPDIS